MKYKKVDDDLPPLKSLGEYLDEDIAELNAKLKKEEQEKKGGK
ncbi:hypothetical protein [Liquorilactobacillus satsumensis]